MNKKIFLILFFVFIWTLDTGYLTLVYAQETNQQEIKEQVTIQPAANENEVKLICIGDVCLDRRIAQSIEEYGSDYPFAGVAETFKWADIIFANLECPVSARGIGAKKQFVFRAKPKYVDVLKKAGITVTCLANNHMLDYGPVGLTDTVKNLDEAGIGHAGAGKNSDEAKQPCIIEKNGLKIAFLSFYGFASIPGQFLCSSPCVARPDFNFEQEIKNAKQNADIVVVSFHWGAELSDTPSVTQQKLAHRAVRGGADVVIGHHPHTLQGVERYNGKLIFYSVGNFLFTSPTPKTNDTIIVKLTLAKNGVTDHNIIPVRIDGVRPRIADENESGRIMARLEKLSEGLTELAADKVLPLIK